jgi:hypothetical protein
MSMNVKYASLKRTTKLVPIETAFEKSPKFSGWKLTKRFFDWCFEKMKTRGFLQPYDEKLEIQTYVHTESKRKLLSDKIMDMILTYERDFDRVNPEKHVIIMGEDDFFTAVQEKNVSSPFFGYETVKMPSDLEYRNNYGSVMSISVHVVPGLMGFAILPKAIIEKRR